MVVIACVICCHSSFNLPGNGLDNVQVPFACYSWLGKKETIFNLVTSYITKKIYLWQVPHMYDYVMRFILNQYLNIMLIHFTTAMRSVNEQNCMCYLEGMFVNNSVSWELKERFVAFMRKNLTTLWDTQSLIDYI